MPSFFPSFLNVTKSKGKEVATFKGRPDEGSFGYKVSASSDGSWLFFTDPVASHGTNLNAGKIHVVPYAAVKGTGGTFIPENMIGGAGAFTFYGAAGHTLGYQQPGFIPNFKDGRGAFVIPNEVFDSNKGVLYVVPLQQNMTSVDFAQPPQFVVELRGADIGGKFGHEWAYMPSFGNNDPKLVVSAFTADAEKGKVFLWDVSGLSSLGTSSSPQFTDTSSFVSHTIVGPQASARLGRAVGYLGDMGNGKPALGVSSVDTVYVGYGETGLPSQLPLSSFTKITGTPGELFGDVMLKDPVASASSQYGTLVVSKPFGGDDYQGGVFVVPGGPKFMSSQTWTESSLLNQTDAVEVLGAEDFAQLGASLGTFPGYECDKNAFVFESPSFGSSWIVSWDDIKGAKQTTLPVGTKVVAGSNSQERFGFSTYGVPVDETGLGGVIFSAWNTPPRTGLYSGGAGYLLQGDTAPVITKFSLTLTNGNTVTSHSDMLSVTQCGKLNPQVVLTFSNPEGVEVRSVSTNEIISSCTVAQWNAGQVKIVHQGNNVEPKLSVQAKSPLDFATPLPAKSAAFDFTPVPILTVSNKPLIVDQGKSVSITDQFSVSRPGLLPEQIIVRFENIKGGFINLRSAPTQAITECTEAQRIAGLQFTAYDSKDIVPGFDVIAQDSSNTSPAQAIVIERNTRPEIISNALEILPTATGKVPSSVPLPRAAILAKDLESSNKVRLQFDGVTGGSVQLVDKAAHVPSQVDVDTNNVVFIPDQSLTYAQLLQKMNWTLTAVDERNLTSEPSVLSLTGGEDNGVSEPWYKTNAFAASMAAIGITGAGVSTALKVRNYRTQKAAEQKLLIDSKSAAAGLHESNESKKDKRQSRYTQIINTLLTQIFDQLKTSCILMCQDKTQTESVLEALLQVISPMAESLYEKYKADLQKSPAPEAEEAKKQFDVKSVVTPRVLGVFLEAIRYEAGIKRTTCFSRFMGACSVEIRASEISEQHLNIIWRICTNLKLKIPTSKMEGNRDRAESSVTVSTSSSTTAAEPKGVELSGASSTTATPRTRFAVV